MRTYWGGLLIALSVGCSGGNPGKPNTSNTQEPLVTKKVQMGEIPVSELEKRNLKTLWTHPLGRRIDQAWFLLENIYITSPNERRYDLLKINGETGLVDWIFPLEGKLQFAPSVYRYVRELRATHPDELFVIQNDQIYCIDDQYGAENYRISCGFPVSTSVAPDQDLVLVGSWNKRIYSLSKASRLQGWTYITGAPLTAPLEISGGNVYAASEDSIVYCLSLTAGFVPGKSWSHATGGKIVIKPLFYHNRIYLGSWDYKVYCLEQFEGHERWSYPSGAPVTRSLFPFRDAVFAVSESEGPLKWSLVCLDDSDGRRKWERPGMQRVVAADGLYCYVLDSERYLQALRLDDGKSAWRLDVRAFKYVLTQDAEQGRARELWGRIYLANRDGLMQAIQPRR